MIEVHCTTCHRVEAWSTASADTSVVTPGGRRRPGPSATREAWALVRAAHEPDGRIVVGACPECGQPLTAAPGAPLPHAAWRLDLSSGSVVVAPDGSIEGPHGALSWDDAEARVLAATIPPPWHRRLRLGQSMFTAGVLLGLAGPLTAFLIAVLALSIFFVPAWWGAFR